MQKFTKQPPRTKFLLATNLITAFLLIGLFIKVKYPDQATSFLSQSTGNQNGTKYSYLENLRYVHQVDFYRLYTGQKNIVMLGNSLTERIDWAELLGRPDVANRGISGDITEGMLKRIAFVFQVHPRVCFIEGGVNDLTLNIPQDTIIKNLAAIADTLRARNIKPVLNTVTHVAASYRNASGFNARIKDLNKAIRQLAAEKNIPLIDLNPKISKDNALIPVYALEDGLHYPAHTYLIWKAEIQALLSREKW